MPLSRSSHRSTPPAEAGRDPGSEGEGLFDAGPRRPDPPLPLIQRFGGVVERFGPTPGRLVGAAVAVAIAVALAVWLLRPPPPPVETSLPTVPPATPPVPGAGPTPRAGTASTGTGTGTVDGAAGPTAATTEVVVHAAGAVTRPGLYRFPAEARVADVIDAAGGLAADADGDRLNLAAPLADGLRVYVPRVGEAVVPPVVTGGEPPPGTGSAVEGDPATGGPVTLVDLNTATATELETLPGVGPATAAAIIDHREQQGPFATVDDLLDVRGIGDAKLAALRDLVRV